MVDVGEKFQSNGNQDYFEKVSREVIDVPSEEVPAISEGESEFVNDETGEILFEKNLSIGRI